LPLHHRNKRDLINTDIHLTSSLAEMNIRLLFVSGIYMYMGGSIIVLSALHFPQSDCPGSNSNDYIRIAENQRCKPSPLVQNRRLERENCSSYWMSYDIL
jgi:hypothetical protein